MDRIVSIFWTLAEVISTVFISDTLLIRKTRDGYIYVGIVSSFLIIFAFTNLYKLSIPPAYISFAAYLLLTLCYYRGSLFLRVMSAIMSILFLTILDAFVIFLWSIYQNIDFSAIVTRKFTYLSIGTVSKSSALFVSWVIRCVRSKKNSEKPQVRWLALTLLFPAISLIMLLVVYDSFQHNTDLSLKALGFTFVIALGNIGILYLIHQLERSELKLRKSALLNQQMAIQTQSILTLEKSYRNQRKISHEFSHHLNTIQLLLDNKEYSVVSDYVHELQNKKLSGQLCVNSHNPIVDAILNAKYQLALEHGIDMQIRVSNLSALNISTESIVVMLSNLLDNAIDACIACSDEKRITISFICDKTIFITIDNTSNPVVFVDGKPVTTKNNSLNHGFGVDNTCKILDDLNAEYAFRYNDGFFHFVAEIPLQ